MTREEEIKDFAIKRFGNDGNESQFMLSKMQACIVGAQWADRTMVDKVCDWLLNHADNYVVMAGCGCYYNNIGLVNDLRKAMEETE